MKITKESPNVTERFFVAIRAEPSCRTILDEKTYPRMHPTGGDFLSV